MKEHYGRDGGREERERIYSDGSENKGIGGKARERSELDNGREGESCSEQNMEKRSATLDL